MNQISLSEGYFLFIICRAKTNFLRLVVNHYDVTCAKLKLTRYAMARVVISSFQVGFYFHLIGNYSLFMNKLENIKHQQADSYIESILLADIIHTGRQYYIC